MRRAASRRSRQCWGEVEPSGGTASPWVASRRCRTCPYLRPHYVQRREGYLGERTAWNADLDVYGFPRGRTLRIVRRELVAQDVEAWSALIRLPWGGRGGARAGRVRPPRFLIAGGQRAGPGASRAGGGNDGRQSVGRLVFHGVTVGVVRDQPVQPSRDLLAGELFSTSADSHDVHSIAWKRWLLGNSHGVSACVRCIIFPLPSISHIYNIHFFSV